MLIRALTLVAIIASWSVGIATEARAQGGLAQMAERFYRMGHDALNNRDWPDCIENLTQVVEIDVEHLDAYLDLAYCQEQMQQYRDAVSTYREAFKIAPDDRKADILSRKAWAQASGGELEGAVESYRALIELQPDDKVSWEGLAFTYKNLGQQPEAIMAYERALELEPTDINLYRTLGELCEQAGVLEQSARVYERWMENDPENVEPARRLAYIYSKLEVCDKGERLYTRVMELDPSQPGDLLNLGYLQQKCGNPDKALATFESYRAQRPDDSAVDCRIVFLYEDVGRPGPGIDAAKSSLAKYPDDPCILLGYARLLDLLGDSMVKQKKFDDAMDVYRSGIAKCQKIISDATFGSNAQKQISRFEQLIARTEKMKLQEELGY